ncbi:MAG: signal peptide peptidase SppA [Sphingobium sp.]|nr:signal peptide peptidase SppA [Sphingobium sp.]MCP5398661.1 signal peptide peptidase SppA [Sphingomonas sp.]
MAFLRAVWRFVMGVKDVLVLCFLLLFFIGLYGALSFTGGERPVKSHSGALVLDLDGVVVEQPDEVDPAELLFSSEAPTRQYRLRDIVQALEAAANDNDVKAIVLDLDGFMGGGQVALSRIGEALDRVRAVKKPVIAYATIYEGDSYQLAAHASEIWVNPLGGVLLAGPGGSSLYYKGLIDKLGINTHIYRVGTYKSAVEPFMRSDQSPEARDARQALADILWQNWQDEVKKARPQVALASYTQNPVAVAEAANGDMSTAAQAAKLVDKVGNRTAFESRIAEISGEAKDSGGPDFASIPFDDYVRKTEHKADGAIGVLTVAGEIVDGDGGSGMAGGDRIADQLRQALDEKDLKALVVRVDSPGGSVTASEQIREAILTAKTKGLPVVTSMGNVAASGGYWISTASDRILAEPSTITGSIGVFGIIPSFEGMLDKIGVNADGVKTTPLSGEPDLAGGLSDDFNRIMQLGVEDTYRRFLNYVGKARNMPPEKVDEIAQGRVWAGGTARQLGLVDQFGGIEDAIAEAAKLAKLDPAKAKPYYIEPKPDPFTQFLTELMTPKSARVRGKDILARHAARQQAQLKQIMADMQMLASSGSVQAYCLECRAHVPTSANISRTDGDTGIATWLTAILERK